MDNITMDRFAELSEIRREEIKTGKVIMTDQESMEMRELATIRLHELLEENADVFKRLADR